MTLKYPNKRGQLGLTKVEFEKLRKEGLIKKGTRWDTWKKKMK